MNRNTKALRNVPRVLTLILGAVLIAAVPAHAAVPIGVEGSYNGDLPNTHTAATGLTPLPTNQLLTFVLQNPAGQDFVNGRALAYDGVSIPPQLWANFAAGGWNPETKIYRLNTVGVNDLVLDLGTPTGALDFDAGSGLLYGGSFPMVAPQTPTGIPGEVFTIDTSTSTLTSLFVFDFPSFDACVLENPGFITGLAYDASDNSVWLSQDTGKTVYNVDLTGCDLVPAAATCGQTKSSFLIDAAGGHCATGLALVDGNLWISDVRGTGVAGEAVGQLIQVSRTGTGLQFIDTTITATQPNQSDDVYLPYDLEFDAQTFAPACVLWSNEASFDAPRIAAWEVPCPATGGGGGGGGGTDPPTDPPAELEVQIDIKPGNFENTINLGASGSIPVAVLSSSTFDATTLDMATLKLAGAGVRVVGKKDPNLQCSQTDVNGDGLMDVKCHILNDLNTDAIKLTETGDSEAHMQCDSYPDADGKVQKYKGHDRIRIVPDN